MKSRHPDGEIEPDLSAHRNRLKRDSPIGAADEDIGAQTRSQACFAGRADTSGASCPPIAGPMMNPRPADTLHVKSPALICCASAGSVQASAIRRAQALPACCNMSFLPCSGSPEVGVIIRCRKSSKLKYSGKACLAPE